MKKGLWGTGLSFLCAFAGAFFVFTGAVVHAAGISCQVEKAEVKENAYVLTIAPEENFLPLAEECTALLDNQNCKVNSVEAASHENVGITYDVMVDISGSMRQENRIEEAKAILGQILSGMKEGDLFRLTKMGNERTSTEFLSSPEEAQSFVESLESIPNEDTNLYKAVVEELSDLKRENTNWKKTLILLSDGHDDQKTGITKEEADKAVQDSWIPVFTIAMLRENNAEEEEYAKILGSFARLSRGGEHFAPVLEGYPYSEIYGKLIETLDREFMLSLDLGSVMTSKEEMELELSLSDGSLESELVYPVRMKDVEKLLGLVYTVDEENTSVSVVQQLEKEDEKPEAGAPGGGAGSSGATAPEAGETPDLIARLTSDPMMLGLIIGGIVLLIAILILVIVLLTKKKKRKAQPVMEEGEVQENLSTIPGEEPRENGYAAGAGFTLPEAEPAILLALEPVNGEQPLYLRFFREAFMGRGSGCQLSLPTDPILSETHCVFHTSQGRIFIRDNGSTNGTYVNGMRVTNEVELAQGDTLLAGSLEYKVSWQEG